MTVVVGVQAVVLVSVVVVFFVHGVEAAGGIPVNHGNGPDVASLFHAFHEVADEVSVFVGKVFCRLPVLLVGIETGAVNGREQHDLLFGIHALNRVERRVDATAQCVFVKAERAVAAHFPVLGAPPVGINHRVVFHLIPFSDGHAVVPVVGSHENENGVHIVAVFFLELVSLTDYIVPLSSADTIHKRLNAKPFFQPSPVFLFGGTVAWVGYRVAQIGHPFSLPWMFKEGLCHGIHAQHHAYR